MCSVYTILGQPSYFDFPFRTLLMQKLELIVMIKYWKIYQQVEKRLKQKFLEKLNRKIKSFITLYFCTDFGLSMWTNHFNVNIRRSLSLQHQYLSKLGKYKLAFINDPDLRTTCIYIHGHTLNIVRTCSRYISFSPFNQLIWIKHLLVVVVCSTCGVGLYTNGLLLRLSA